MSNSDLIQIGYKKNQVKRSCGDCIACCVYLRIPELKKGGMQHCSYLNLPGEEKEDERYYTGKSKEGNCKIYNDPIKPKCCSGYSCAWKLGHGNIDDRPDKSLFIFDTSKRIENSLEAKPLSDGQELTEEGKSVIDRMSKSYGTPVIVLNFYERKIQRIVGRAI